MPPDSRLRDAGYVIREANELEMSWNSRNAKIPKWYDVLLLKDELAQTGMESFVSNDPRTFYNLSKHLLTPKVIPHRIREESERITEESRFDQINRFLESNWSRIDKLSRRRGKQSWLGRLVGLVLATGWYSVFAIATKETLSAEVWHPLQTFPEFGEDELLRCVHKYSIPPNAARRKLISHPDWNKGINLPESNYQVVVLDYWKMEVDGPYNVVVMNNQVAKPYQKTPFTEIPILVGPVGGLPDDGVIQTGGTWQEHYGESIVATNERVYRDYNKQMTFLQQLLRDTAQPAVLEKSDGSPIIKDPEDLYRRGAVFRMGTSENISVLDKGAVPVDVRTVLFDIGNMVQRGSLPAALFGNIQQEIAAYLMSQIASTAHQALGDYKDAIKAVLEDVDKLWLTQMRDQNLSPYGFSIPAELPIEFDVDVGLEISIPGDLVQRISAARVANPLFRLSQHSILSLMFPEISDPLAEQAKANAEMALQGDIARIVTTIRAFRDEAERLRTAGDSASAQSLESAAQVLEARLGEQSSPPAGPGGSSAIPTGPSAPPGEVIPREMLGMGGR